MPATFVIRSMADATLLAQETLSTDVAREMAVSLLLPMMQYGLVTFKAEEGAFTMNPLLASVVQVLPSPQPELTDPPPTPPPSPP